METAVSAPGHEPAGGGRSNGVYGPPFPLTFLSLTLLSAGVGTPRDFMAPNTCDGTYRYGEGRQPDFGLATCWSCNCVVLGLLSVAVVLALLLRLGRAVRRLF